MSTEEESREAASGGDHTNPPAVAGKEDAAGSGEHHEQGEGREAAGAEGEEAETADTGAKDDGAAPEDGEGTEGAEDAVGAEDAEAGEGGEVEKEPEDPVFALRDKLIRILDDTSPDLTQARDILDALMEKWDNIDVPQIVLPGKESLGMIVRRLRKHEDEELATRAGRLYGMYQTEVRTEYNAKMEKLRKQKEKQKEKSDRKKALASMSKDKTKSANQASERKQKREKNKEEGAEKKKSKAKKDKRKRKASSDEDEKSEGEKEEEEEMQESPKKKKPKKEKKEKKQKPKGKGKDKKKQSKSADSGDDDDMPEQELFPEPEASDVPGRIKYLLHKMIQTADLQTLTTRLCKEHVREQFGAEGEAVLSAHKQLIKDTIDQEVQRRN